MKTTVIITNIMAVLLVLVAFFLNRRRKGEEGPEDQLFFSLCFFALGMAAVKLSVELFLPRDVLEEGGVLTFAADYANDLITLGLLSQWVLFVDYMLHKSKDHLRIETPRIIRITAIFASINTAIVGLVAYAIYVKGVENSILLSVLLVLAWFGVQMMELTLLIISIRKMAEFRKRRKGPITFSGIPFVVPVLLGIVVSTVFGFYVDITPISIAIGLFMLLFSIKMERENIDAKTGCYTRNYLKYFKLEEKHYQGGVGILITSPEGDEELAELLKSDCPEGVDIIRLEKGSYYLLGEKTEKETLGILIGNIKMDAEEEQITLDVRYDMRGENESVEALLGRLQEMGAAA